MIVPLDFMGNAAMLEPVDKKLHDMLVEWCAKELVDGKDINLARFQKVWVSAEKDDSGWTKINGMLGFVWRADIPVFRATDQDSLYLLAERANNYFADNGSIGYEVFVHVAKRERPEQRCPGWAKALAEWGAESSDRLSIKVR